MLCNIIIKMEGVLSVLKARSSQVGGGSNNADDELAKSAPREEKEEWLRNCAYDT